MTGHSLIGGSTAGRILACPGSLRILRQYPQTGTTSPAAEEGSRLHEAIALAVEGAQDWNVCLDPEQERLVDAAMRQWEGLCVDSMNCLEVEHSVTWAPELPEAFGTADLLYRDGGRNVILDWKFGRQPVTAENNPQLLFYAAGAMLSWPAFDPEAPTDLVIVQPRVYPEPQVYTVDTARINDFIDDLLDAVERDTLAIGEHCRWCPVQHLCPLWQTTAERYQGPLPTDLTELLDLAEGVERYIAALRAEATRRLEQGETITGWHLVPKRPTRKWIDEAVVRQWAKKVKLKVADIEEHRLKSPAQMEKLCAAHGLSLDNIEHLTVRESSGLTLARTN